MKGDGWPGNRGVGEASGQRVSCWFPARPGDQPAHRHSKGPSCGPWGAWHTVRVVHLVRPKRLGWCMGFCVYCHHSHYSYYSCTSTHAVIVFLTELLAWGSICWGCGGTPTKPGCGTQPCDGSAAELFRWPSAGTFLHSSVCGPSYLSLSWQCVPSPKRGYPEWARQ